MENMILSLACAMQTNKFLRQINGYAVILFCAIVLVFHFITGDIAINPGNILFWTIPPFIVFGILTAITMTGTCVNVDWEINIEPAPNAQHHAFLSNASAAALLILITIAMAWHALTWGKVIIVIAGLMFAYPSALFCFSFLGLIISDEMGEDGD